jgi:hypothetical protein
LTIEGTKKWLLKSDANTGFFDMCTNGRRRKSRICSLDTSEEIITDQKEISPQVVDFYKKLFGSSSHQGVHLC